MNDSSIKRLRLNDDTVVLDPGRMLDNNNAHEMVDEITTILAGSTKNIIIDMTELVFLSSAGVGSILGTIETAREQGGDIILCNVSATILHILQVLDLHEYLTIKPNRKEAVAACGV